MKFRLTFKTPHVLENAIVEASNDLNESVDSEQQIRKLLERYVKYDEYLAVEFDTNADTATVVRINQ